MMALVRMLLFLPPGASSAADEIDLLHLFVISVTMAVSAYVFVTLAWFTIRFARKKKGQLTPRVVGTRLHETIVTVAITATFVLWWVIGFRQYAAMTDPPKDADVVYVDAKQWMWKFAYPDGRTSNDVLTVPVDRPIRLVMTSRDVIHSFYVPAFRLKQDVVPGRTTSMWFRATAPGRYAIRCAEYCGLQHSSMQGEVVVLSAEDYARWKSDALPPQGLAARGREVAARRQCLACHTLDGKNHVGPTWRGLYGSERVLVDGRRVIADEAYLTRSMIEPNAEIVEGWKPVMPSYQGALDPAEAGALVELIKSLREGGPQ